MYEFKIPEVGENIHSGNVVNVFVSVGDRVSKDQDLLELETEKASLPVPSPEAGVVREILIKSGDEVKIGQTVMKIEPAADADSAAPTEKTPPQGTAQQPVSVTTPPQTFATVSSSDPNPVSKFFNFAARRNEDIPAQKDVPAAPSVRRLARELGVDVSSVPGSGPGGRISKEDVKAFVKQVVLTGGGPAAVKKPLPDFAKFGSVRREKMSKIRQVTKDHMAFCWNTIPHVTQFDKADITELEKVRKANSTEERKLTVTPFLIKVLAAALKEFPQFNCSIDAETNEIIYKDYIHIGVAVDTDRGLLVPVLRDAEKKSFFEITDELAAAAERARNKKTALNELQGGSITVTNLGSIGGFAFTPIVNWPEVCILGVSRGGFEPSYDKQKGSFVPRFKLPLCLSYDHRIINGADAARFLRWVCENLEHAGI